MNEFIGMIENISISEGSKVYFYGYSFIKGIDINKSENIKVSLIISNKEKRYFVPTENILRYDLTEKFGENNYNYDYAGFFGFIDVGFLDNMNPLSYGTWKISIYVCINDIEGEYDIDAIENLKLNDLVITFIKENKQIDIGIMNKKVIIESRTYSEKNAKSTHIYNQKNKYNKDRLSLKQILSKYVFNSLYKILKRLKIKNNRVVFLSDSRSDFSGNFECIYKELVSNGCYDIKYILKARIDERKTIQEKIKFIYYISTSKYILLDDYYPQIYNYDIKDDIEVIQLWHACGAFKTFGFSRMGKAGGPNPRSRNHKNYTKAIVSSKNIKKYYAEAFGISEDKVISTGIPRTDIFFNEEYKANKIKELYNKYPMLVDKKIILFAPTFRGNGQKNAYYDFEKLNVEKLKQSLGNEYNMILKLHPFISEEFKIDESYKDFIIDLSLEREINDLLFISDIMITDYSSVCFEFSLLNKPMIFFAYDLEEYIESRDFYYPFEFFVPGPIARTTDDIIDIIKYKKFESKKLDKFRNKFFDYFDGKSTRRVVQMLMNIEK